MSTLNSTPEKNDISIYLPPPSSPPCLQWKSRRTPRSQFSSFLNATSLFLAIGNFYTQIPASPSYSFRVGLSDQLSGVLLAIIPIIGIPASVIYSRISSKFGFRFTMIFIFILLAFANLVFVFAASSKSAAQLILAKVLYGIAFPGSTVVSWVSKSFGTEHVKKESAKLALVIAICISFGVLVAAVLSPINAHAGPVYFDEMTLPGWAYFAFSVIHVALLFKWYEEPIPAPECQCPDCMQETGYKTEKKQTEKVASNDVAKVPIRGTFKEALPAFVLMIINMFGRMAMATFEVASPLVADQHFNWSVTESAFYLAAVSVLVVPMYFIHKKYLMKYSERKTAAVLLAVNIVGCAVMVQYGTPDGNAGGFSVAQYVIGGALFFTTISMLYGTIQSLFIKTFPKNFSIPGIDIGVLSMGCMAVGRSLGSVLGSQFSHLNWQENIVVGILAGCSAIGLLLFIGFYRFLKDQNNGGVGAKVVKTSKV